VWCEAAPDNESALLELVKLLHQKRQFKQAVDSARASQIGSHVTLSTLTWTRIPLQLRRQIIQKGAQHPTEEEV
jgi:hypothetical protein